MTANTKFTVVIPTRERSDTLRHTLRTCTAQDYEELEILVSDNASEDDTRAVVESAADPRIRYLNTGRRVSMTENWEFALSHVANGFVTVIGDDDGLLPNALVELNEIIRETGTDAISWKRAPYFWPGADEVWGNTLRVPLASSLRRMRSASAIQDVLRFDRPYTVLPLLYNGMVRHESIERIRDGGRIFHSVTPDIYSGFAIAGVIDSYFFSSRPFGLEGVSRHSNGRYLSRDNAATQQASSQFLNENTLPVHPTVVMCPSLPIIVAEAFFQARDHVAPLGGFRIDLRQVLRLAAKQAVTASPAQFEAITGALREIGARNQMEAFVEELLHLRHNRPAREFRPVPGFDPAHGSFVLDCAEFGAKNSYDAAVLCRHALILRERGYGSIRGLLASSIGHVRRQISKRLGGMIRE
jgi:hypothetical protein